jgi:hypothetical protein
MGEGFTIYDLQTAGSNRSRRELPRVIAGALRLIWAAGRREFVTVLLVEALAAAGLAGLVLLGREVLQGVLAADSDGTGWSGLVPELAALAALSTVLAVTQALVGRQQPAARRAHLAPRAGAHPGRRVQRRAERVRRSRVPRPRRACAGGRVPGPAGRPRHCRAHPGDGRRRRQPRRARRPRAAPAPARTARRAPGRPALGPPRRRLLPLRVLADRPASCAPTTTRSTTSASRSSRR